MDKKVKLSLNKTMVSRLQNNEQNSIWGETAPATWWILRKPRLSINL
ncbi:MAG TPA: class I lanthipeptide [Bacteroidetes bacterium]|nr:class I lanthipeptide [Candidatus Limimorpha avicola]